uniref:Putative seminal fluid protein AcpC04 n=1 Tax=Cephalota litorea TaxID=292452 RepID=A0A0F7PWS8_9CARA|nr:putative seminal fluid protein AcpC04 [Cephalota litorea]
MSKNKRPCCGTTSEERTINLAKQGNSLEERRTRLLVFEKSDPPQPYIGAQLPPGITNLKCPKKIRVCTALDMKKTCPPPVCDCPPLRPPFTILGMIRKCAILGCKSVVVGSLIYWTWDIGLWGNQEKTHRLYHEMKDFLVTSEEDDNHPYEHPSQMSHMIYNSKSYWNWAISRAFSYTRVGYDKVASVFSPKIVCQNADEISDTGK